MARNITQYDLLISCSGDVINVGGYIGDSTRSEIVYAKEHGKGILYLEEPF